MIMLLTIMHSLEAVAEYSADQVGSTRYPDVGIEVSSVQQFFLCKTKRKPNFLCEALNPHCVHRLVKGIEIPDLIESKRLWGINWQQSFSYAINLSNQVQVNTFGPAI